MSIKKNLVFHLINMAVSFLVPLIVTPYLSRIFLASGTGINSYITANTTYFTLFSMLGISGYGQREVAICRNDREKISVLFWELQLIHLITFLVTGAAYLLLALKSVQYGIYYLSNFALIVACFFDITWFYQGCEQFRFIAIRNCIVRIALMICTFLLIRERSDLPLYIFITSASTLISNLSLWVDIKKYVDFVPLRQLKIRKHLKNVIIYFIPTIAASVYSILDKSVINWITHEDSENGYYEQAYKILTIANGFIQSLASVSAPRMSNLYANGHSEAFAERMNRSLQFMLCIAIPTAFGIAAITPRFVPFFFGNGYDKVASILYIFMPLVVILGFSVYLDTMYLVPSGKRAESAMIICAGAAINLVLNIVFVIKCKSVGAAFATLVTEAFIAGMMTFLSRKVVYWRQTVISLMKYTVISVCMFLSVRWIGSMILNDAVCIVAQICFGVLFYGSSLLLIRDEFAADAIRIVRSVFHI